MSFSKTSERMKFIVIGILMLISLVLPHIPIFPHNPLTAEDSEVARHLELGYEVSENTAHSHDNGTYDEADLEHQHDHNSADHSHFSALLSAHDISTVSQLNAVFFVYKRSHLSPPPFPLQRPPKLTHVS